MDGECAVSQLASAVGPHCIEVIVANEVGRVGSIKAMVMPAGHHIDPQTEAGGKNLLGKEMIVDCAITQLAIVVVTHHPDGTARQVETMQSPRGTLLNPPRETL